MPRKQLEVNPLSMLDEIAELSIAGSEMPNDAEDRCEWYANRLVRIRALAKNLIADRERTIGIRGS